MDAPAHLDETVCRKYHISNTAVTTLRRYLPNVAHNSDEELRDKIDRVVRLHDKYEHNVETFWERTPDYGTLQNTVIKLGRIDREALSDTYAIVRDSDNGKVIVTLISEHSKREAELTRWSVEPPDLKKRTRSSSSSPQSESINTPFENIKDDVGDLELKEQEYLIRYHAGEGVEPHTLQMGGSALSSTITDLIGKGIKPEAITVWAKLENLQIKVSVDIKGL